MIVADSDVLIDFLSGRGAGADAVARELETGDLHTTAISRFELLSGVKTERQASSVARLLAAVPALAVDSGAADSAAEIRRHLEARGETIGMADSLIAGTVVRHGGKLMTRNTRHFARIVGLELVALDA